MIQDVDLAGLATDVDRLFRLRQGHFAAPLGDGVNGARGYEWKAAPEEAHAHHVLKAVHGEEVPDLHAEVIERDRPRWLRTRAHVTMLGLLYPEFLAARLRATGDRRKWLRDYFVGKVADIAAMRRGLRARHIQGLELYVVMQRLLPDDRAVSRLFVAKAVLAHLCGRAIEEFPVEPETEPTPADLARTATYLACLSERLRVWREAEAAKAAVLKAAEDALSEDRDDRGAYPASDWVDVNGDADILAELV